MRILNIASGSKGNCTLVEIGGKNILIDVGTSYKNINNQLLVNRGIDMYDIDVILISHR